MGKGKCPARAKHTLACEESRHTLMALMTSSKLQMRSFALPPESSELPFQFMVACVAVKVMVCIQRPIFLFFLLLSVLYLITSVSIACFVNFLLYQF
jgi:hypothetical protein